jgi:catechol 2,3-dioxygenase-like lactoylglutathione lyase family enzyme
MDSSLWNIGIKVEDLDREVNFLEALGAEVLLREGGTALLAFGGTRLFLTPNLAFEDKLDYQPMPGLTHAVFEVEDFEAAYEEIVGLGTEVLVEPKTISGRFGSRRLAFFRSPNGLVFEVMQIFESTVN